MKAKDTLPTMISSFARLLLYLKVNGGPPSSASLSDQVARLEFQIKAQCVPQKITTYNHPVKRSIWDPPLNINTTSVQFPAPTTLMMYKSVVQYQLATTTQYNSNQNQPAATTSLPQQRSNQDQDKMKTGSTKSDISEISATPTIHTVMTAASAITKVVAEMKNVVKAIDDDRKNREEKQNNHESKEKKLRRKTKQTKERQIERKDK